MQRAEAKPYDLFTRTLCIKKQQDQPVITIYQDFGDKIYLSQEVLLKTAVGMFSRDCSIYNINLTCHSLIGYLYPTPSTVGLKKVGIFRYIW